MPSLTPAAALALSFASILLTAPAHAKEIAIRFDGLSEGAAVLQGPVQPAPDQEVYYRLDADKMISVTSRIDQHYAGRNFFAQGTLTLRLTNLNSSSGIAPQPQLTYASFSISTQNPCDLVSLPGWPRPIKACAAPF